MKIIISPAGFELMTYRFLDNALTHCTTLLGNNFAKKKNYILNFFVYFNVKCGGVSYHLKS